MYTFTYVYMRWSLGCTWVDIAVAGASSELSGCPALHMERCLSCQISPMAAAKGTRISFNGLQGLGHHMLCIMCYGSCVAHY